MKRRISALLLALCMIFSIAQPAMAYSTVQNGSRGNDVKTLQTMLNTVQQAKLSVDGIFGADTKKAVQQFQKNNGLTADGICGPKTWEKLEAKYKAATAQKTDPHPTIQNGSSGAAVKELQTLLNEKMGEKLSVDGLFGKDTTSAVKRFQSKAGLSVDGICGPKTWAALLNYKPEPQSPWAISIASGKYNPGTLKQGSPYSISGKITSTYELSLVTVGIYDSSRTATSFVKRVNPNAKSYDIRSVDSEIKFGRLSPGSYFFIVVAYDSRGNQKTLVNNGFTVSPSSNMSPKTIYNVSSLDKVPGELQCSTTDGVGLCTSAATATMLRRKLFLDGKPVAFNIGDIRKSLGASVADLEKGVLKGLKFSFARSWDNSYTLTSGITSYTTVTVTAGSMGSSVNARQKYVAEKLDSHPEGVVLYSNGHAIVITGYTKKANGTFQFYAQDPQTAKNGKDYPTTPYPTKLEETYLYIKCGKDVTAIFSKLERIWYVK